MLSNPMQVFFSSWEIHVLVVSHLEASIDMYPYKRKVMHCNSYLLALYAYATQHKWLKKVSGTVSWDLNATASKTLTDWNMEVFILI